MQAVLALAFLAVANAAFFDRQQFDDALWHKNFDAYYKHHMITGHNGIIPKYMMDVEGVESVDPFFKSKNFQPSLIFFKGPDGKIISYYAHEGIDKVKFMPEVKTAFDDLYGAADKVAVHFAPEEILGGYKSVLPGHFFQPEHNIALGRYMQDMPFTHDFVPMKFAKQGMFPMKVVDIDSLPSFYKYPVSLDMTRSLYDSSVVPAGHGFTGLPVVPVTNPAIAPMMGSGAHSFFRSGLTPAYHLVKADYPYFTASPATGLVDSSAILKSSNVLGSGIVPVPAGGLSLGKTACVGCVGDEFVPTFKTIGGHHLVNPVVPLAHSLYTNPMASYIPLTF